MTDGPWWHDPTGEPDPAAADAVGAAAAEAGRLFEALRDRMLSDPATLRAGMKLMESFTVLRGGASAAAPGQASECAYCPVCQAISRARAIDPDSVERLTGAAMEFAEKVRDIVGQGQPSGDDRVRHVPLDDEDPATDSGDPADVDDFAGWPEPRDPAVPLDPDDD
ncbi:MAG: hypothetical protein U0R64_04880 [Candidatus Nanopelagicales bacterium]